MGKGMYCMLVIMVAGSGMPVDQEGCKENRYGNQIKEGEENRNDVGSVLHYHR